jgi:hypothetical protein
MTADCRWERRHPGLLFRNRHAEAQIVSYATAGKDACAPMPIA